MAIKCICGNNAQMVRGSKEDYISSLHKPGTKEEYFVKRVYQCDKCGREFETTEQRTVLPLITIINKDSNTNENFFQPTKYKDSLNRALVDEKNKDSIITEIMDAWLMKCEYECYEKEYTYTIEELKDFTIEELSKRASKKSSIRYQSNIGFDEIKRNPTITKEYYYVDLKK